MTKSILNFVLVGCGRIAKRHSDLLGNNQIEGARLVAVCDTSKERAQEIANKYSVSFYQNMHDMMKNEDVDVIVILTPSGMHASHTIELSEYNKDIIVEKPMALTLDDADNMIRACDNNGCKLFVIKQNRFNVPVVKLREAVEKKRFGKMVMGTVRVRWCREQAYYDQDEWRGTWAMDGGVLANQASHHIDMLEWMMGDVESVFARSSTALVSIQVEDTAIVSVKFTSGALGIIEATTATRPENLEGSISVLGEKGSVEVGGFAVNEMKVWKFSESERGDDKILNEFSVNPPNVYGFGHQAYYEHVIDCINNNTAMLVDGLVGRKSLELITAIYESIETGNEVFLKFKPQRCRLGLR